MTDYTTEAQMQLAAYMEQERQKRVVSDILETAFAQNEISSSDDTPDQDHADAKNAARQYAQARNSGTRVRAYAQENKSQREGVQAALEFIERRRLSKIRK